MPGVRGVAGKSTVWESITVLPAVFRGMRVLRLLEFRLSVAGLGGDDGWGYNHSDEGEGDKQIVHWGSTPL